MFKESCSYRIINSKSIIYERMPNQTFQRLLKLMKIVINIRRKNIERFEEAIHNSVLFFFSRIVNKKTEKKLCEILLRNMFIQ